MGISKKLQQRSLRVGASALLAIGLTQIAATAAQADDGQVEFYWTAPAAASIEYGQYWSLPFTSNYKMTPYLTQRPRVVSTGVPAGSEPYLYMTLPDSTELSGFTVMSDTQRPLDAGSYSFSIVLDEPGYYHGVSTSSAKLTVTAAPLGIEARVLADDASENGAIVTARFTGRFAEEYSSTEYPTAPLSPAGTWALQLVDDAGTVVDEASIERAASDDTLATSFYSTNAEPGETYTATATFTPTGQSAKNFVVSPAAGFDYTAPDNTREEPASTEPEKPVADLPDEADFSVPLWWVLLIGILVAALITFTVILAIRLGRAPARRATKPDLEPADAA